MYILICLMLAGAGIGYCLRHIEALQKVEKTIHYTIFLLLFLFGLSLGVNSTVIKNIGSFGWQAGVLAVSAVLGSALSSWIVYRLFFKKGGQET